MRRERAVIAVLMLLCLAGSAFGQEYTFSPSWTAEHHYSHVITPDGVSYEGTGYEVGRGWPPYGDLRAYDTYTPPQPPGPSDPWGFYGDHSISVPVIRIPYSGQVRPVGRATVQVYGDFAGRFFDFSYPPMYGGGNNAAAAAHFCGEHGMPYGTELATSGGTSRFDVAVSQGGGYLDCAFYGEGQIYSAYLVVAVPEPAGLLALGSGLLALAGVAQRRR